MELFFNLFFRQILFRIFCFDQIMADFYSVRESKAPALCLVCDFEHQDKEPERELRAVKKTPLFKNCRVESSRVV